MDKDRIAVQALGVVDRWIEAFPESDVEGIVGLFAPDATFLGTNSKMVVSDAKDIRSYYTHALLNNRPRGAELVDRQVIVLSETVALVTGLDAVAGVNNGRPYRNAGRVSFIVALRENGWRIVHLHRSAVPE